MNDLAPIAKQILESRSVTGEAFARNLFDNPKDHANMTLATIKSKVDIDWHHKWRFDNSTLAGFFDNPIGFWEDFCSNVYFSDGSKGDRYLDALRNIPRTNEYSHFFTPEGVKRLTMSDRAYG